MTPFDVMGAARQVAVVLELTTDPELLAVVRRTAGVLASQLGFPKGQQLSLQEGVEQACQQLLQRSGCEGRTLPVVFTGFSDRLEIVVENEADGTETSEEESYLLRQLLDRVVVEETEAGKLRLTLVKYRSPEGNAQ